MDRDTLEFKAAVTSSQMDIFQKAQNPQQVLVQRSVGGSSKDSPGGGNTAGGSRYSPLRSNSLKLLPESGKPLDQDLRKRSCPDTIPEDHSADHRGKKMS